MLKEADRIIQDLDKMYYNDCEYSEETPSLVTVRDIRKSIAAITSEIDITVFNEEGRRFPIEDLMKSHTAQVCLAKILDVVSDVRNVIDYAVYGHEDGIEILDKIGEIIEDVIERQKNMYLLINKK